jgi:hypothetical protein
MTPHTTTWLLSLATLVGIVWYAYRRGDRMSVAPEEIPKNLAEFIAIELTRMTGHLARGIVHVRPHGERVVFHGAVFLKKGHAVFIEKIFGRMDVEKGNVTSFFLKRIAEHKESLRLKNLTGRTPAANTKNRPQL